jgi:hypothetical protein
LPPPPSLRFPAAWVRQHGPRRAFWGQWAGTTIGLGPPNLQSYFAAEVPQRIEVRREKFMLEAEALAGQDGAAAAPVRARLRQGERTLDLVGTTIRQELTLTPGVNRVEVRAENRDASGDLREYESASWNMEIHYIAEKTEPPQISLQAVQMGELTVPPPPTGQLAVVHERSVRIRGRITASEDLTEATRNGKPLAGFGPAANPRDFLIDETVTLQPGKGNELRFQARTARAMAREVVVMLDYQPDLPGFELTAPANLRLGPGEARKLDLEGRMSELKDPHEYTAEVRVNGQAVAARVDPRERTLTAPLDLRKGGNRVEVWVRNAHWSRLAREFSLYCARPPEEARLEPPAAGDKPIVDLTGWASSPADLPLTGARLVAITTTGKKTRELREAWTWEPTQRLWKITAKAVTLEEGDNRVQLWVRNDDGESLAPAEVKVTYRKPLPTPPRLVFVDSPPGAAVAISRWDRLDPVRDRIVEEPRFAFGFRVESLRPLTRVEVLRDGKRIDPVTRIQDGDGLYYQTSLDLERGSNVLRVVVENDEGGQAHLERTVIYRQPPIRLHLDGLEVPGKTGQFLALSLAGGEVHSAPAPTGTMWLQGHVEWADDKDPALREQEVRVRVSVNDFDLPPVLLSEANGLRRRFRLRVRLTQKEANRVVAHCDLPEEDNTRRAFLVDCAAPVLEQRLNLLAVSPGQRDQGTMKARLLDAFQARDREGDQFSAEPTFAMGRLHGSLLSWNVTRDQVYQTLLEMSMLIRNTSGPFSEVVILYFQGEEVVENGTHYLMTEKARRLGRCEKAAISYDEIRATLSEVPGAKILLLDVHPPAGVAIPELVNQEYPRIGMFRYIWLGGKNDPEEALFVNALRKALAQSVLLMDVKKSLDAEVARSERSTPNVRLRMVNPLGYERLAVGHARK